MNKCVVYGLMICFLIFVVSYWSWYSYIKENKIPIEQNFQSTNITDNMPTKVDMDVSRWQEKETHAYKIKFPKEWFLKEASDNPGLFVITNNKNINGDDNDPTGWPFDVTDDREIIIDIRPELTSVLDDKYETRSKNKIISDALKARIEDMQNEFQIACIHRAPNEIPVFLVCVNDLKNYQRYDVINNKWDVSLIVNKSQNSIVDPAIAEKIARSLVIK